MDTHRSKGHYAPIIITVIVTLITLVPPGSLVDAQLDFSYTTSSLSLTVARSQLAAATVGGMSIFAGGFTAGDGGPTAAVDIYHAHNDSWTTSALSQARGALVATAVGNLALFAGGQVGDGSCTAKVDIYNATSHSWTSAALSVPRRLLAATTVGNLAIFAGGLTTSASDSASAVVDVYNAVNNSWTTMEPLTEARSHLSATTIGDLAIFAYGRRGDGVANLLSTADIYNSTSNSWSNLTLPWARHSVAALTVDNWALFAGGRSTGSFSRVDAYNATGKEWITGGYLTEEIDTMAATTVGNVVGVVAGGTVYGDTTPYSTVNFFILGNLSWIAATSLSQARWAAAGTTIGNKAIIAGGQIASSVSSSMIDIYNFTFVASPSPSPSPSPSTTVSPSPTTSLQSPSPSPIDVVPVLQINNATGLDVLLTPKDRRSGLQEDKTMRISFAGSIKELDQAGALAQQGSPTVLGAWKRVNDSILGASQSYLFSVAIAFNQSSIEDAPPEMEVQFYLFDNPTTIPLDDNGTSVSIEPSLAKFTVRLYRWPWQSDDNTLEMRIRISPSFTNFHLTTEENTGLSSFTLSNQFSNDDQANGVLRLVDFIVLDGKALTQGQGVRFNLDASRSELVLWFAHFNESLIYDPDVGVLFSSGMRGSDDSPSLGLIIGVAVGGAVALLFVLLVIGAVLIVLHMRGRKARTEVTQRAKVNFSYDDFARAVDEEGMEIQPQKTKRARSLSSSSPLASIYKFGV